MFFTDYDPLTEEYVLEKLQAAPAAEDPLAVLDKLKKLMDAGLITEQEYNDKKREVLARM